MSIPVCKHCSKAKKYHQKETLNCPNPSRSLAVTYSTENVYEEIPVQALAEEVVLDHQIKTFTIPEIEKFMDNVKNDKIDDYIEKNAILEVSWNGKEFKFDVEWHRFEVFGDCLNDIYFDDKYEDEWNKGTQPKLTVVNKSTGQRSRVTFESVTCECYSEDENKEPSTTTSKVKVSFNGTEIGTVGDLINIGSGTPVYSFDELKSKIDDYILPLHDKQWVLENIEKNSDADCDDEREDFERWLKSCDGSIILGKPDTANDGTYVMFGMKFDGYLDDVGLLEYITFRRWYDIANAGLVELSCMEGHMDIDEDEHKGITKFMTEIIGRSMYSDTLPDLKSTADCKAFLKSEYGVNKAKRLKKEKWGKIEYRLFESDQGEVYTIVSYNDKLISHYAFDYSEEY